MHRHMHAAGNMHRQIEQNPFVAIFRNLDDPIARHQPGAAQAGGEALHFVSQIRPR